MGRSGIITFKGNPMTLEGEDVAIGSDAPDFTVHYADAGIQSLSLNDLKGKPTIISVVPSLDGSVQTWNHTDDCRFSLQVIQ